MSERKYNFIPGGISAIEVGLEDAEEDDPGRRASAIRNFFAGVLLLAKGALYKKDPILVAKNTKFEASKQGHVSTVPYGKATADVRQIVDRLKTFGLIEQHQALEKLQQLRNNVEHAGVDVAEDDMKLAISNVHDFVVSIFLNALALEPADLFSESAWSTLISTEQARSVIKERCTQSIAGATWLTNPASELVTDSTCLTCGSELLEFSTHADHEWSRVVCRECHSEIGAAELMEQLVHDRFGIPYRDISKGSEPDVQSCFECLHETFVSSEEECFLCGTELYYSACKRCRAQLSCDEQCFTGLCGYCHCQSLKDI